MEDNEREFIKELEALSRKHGLYVWGCGCCESPRLEQLTAEKLDPEAGYVYDEELEWKSPGDPQWDKSKVVK